MNLNLDEMIQKTDAGSLRGIQKEIACDCWFTSQGRSIPRLIKIMDEEGVLHTTDSVHVLYTEEKRYSGIPTVEHLCKISIEGRQATVKLIFRKESCVWSIVSV
ncbi:MAG: thioredoxin family protein [Lachnospiraceae bacterium]|nr:thioredoxin family protein [Lachnospiraceae bacterium]